LLLEKIKIKFDSNVLRIEKSQYLKPIIIFDLRNVVNKYKSHEVEKIRDSVNSLEKNCLTERMELSIVIVNYNVKYFLEQCLYSSQKALKGIDNEVFVVDNNSVDGSAILVREKFPEVILIENKENIGFSKANNQAIRLAKGKYILLLNPDTVVEEETFTKVIGFMEQNPDAGGLGVKMIDGKGTFLPESKRGLPTPWVAFYKMFGLSKVFPKSRKFGKYHLSYLAENEIHEVDVLAGAFMLMRKSVLDKVGLLDEAYFMYGEDIDLSYRITQGGFKNFYFPETTIIHYKGESTKKGSLNYVTVFYNAMIIFARKHFSHGRADVFASLIHLAIYFRAFISASKRIFVKALLPIIDAILVFFGFLIITSFWEKLRSEVGYYPSEFLQIVVPFYVLFLLVGILFSGGYKKPINIYKILRGIFLGLIPVLLLYSLVDERYMFSMAVILFGAVWAGFVLVLLRLVLHWLKVKEFRLDTKKAKKIAIVGHSKEASRVKEILKNTQIQSELAGFVALDKSDKGVHYIGQLQQLKEIIKINRIDEIVFCSENISSGEIIKAMLGLRHLNIDYKIAPPKSLSIIGSNSIQIAGELYIVNVNAISKPSNKRKKRVFDLIASFMLLITSFMSLWFFRQKGVFIKNIIQVLIGKRSWIGYKQESETYESLPILKPGILYPSDTFSELDLDNEKITQLNMLYAKDYSLMHDAKIFFKSWENLDR
jgi:GT2 family glycosyltransferase